MAKSLVIQPAVLYCIGVCGFGRIRAWLVMCSILQKELNGTDDRQLSLMSDPQKL